MNLVSSLNRRIALVCLSCAALAGVGCSRQPKEAGATTPELVIYYNAEEQPSEKSAVSQIIQAQLRQKGIPVRLDPVSNTLYNERLSKGDYQCTLNLWLLDYNDPEGYLTDFYSKAGYRTAKYDNPEYDRLYLAGLRAPTETDKFRYYRQAVDLLSKELPWVPLYSNDELYLFRSGAEGYISNAYQYYDYRRVTLESVRAASDVEVQTFDPALAYDTASKHMVTQAYEGLIALDGQAKIVPALATSWQFSPEGDTLTFHLRGGVRFHQPPGANWLKPRPMDSEDVRASFERLLKSTSPYTYIFNYVQGAEEFKNGKANHVSGFQTPNASTFVIALKQPFPTMLEWLLAPAAYILPREVPTNYDFSRGSVGTGAFALTSWDGAVARFQANGDYWLSEKGVRLPLAKQLSIRIIKDSNAALEAFRAGELDILNVPLALYSEILDGNGNLKPAYKQYAFREVKLLNLKYLAFNMQAAPWGKSVELRRRVSEAIDRRAITDQLFRGKARVATSVIPSGIPGFE
jgi:ABC-type transport system substrate-binding protein